MMLVLAFLAGQQMPPGLCDISSYRSRFLEYNITMINHSGASLLLFYGLVHNVSRGFFYLTALLVDIFIYLAKIMRK